MLRLNLMGHTHITQDGVVIPVSRKAAALIAYLTLEGSAQHRDHLASLLWDSAGALLNLRVELNRLRQQGLDLFPARQSMLGLKLPTDLDLWQSGSAGVQDSNVNAWLALMRGLPLGGLDDLGSGTLRTWLDHQRDQLTARIEQQAGQVLGRLNRQDQPHAIAAIRGRAAELGLELGISTLSDHHPPSGPARDNWPAQTAAVRQILQRALVEPQCLLVWGQRGSARSLLGTAAELIGWHTIQLQYTPNQEHLLHAVLRHLLAPLPAAERSDLENAIMLSSARQNLMRLATLLARQPQPVLLALHALYEVPDWLNSMLGVLMDLRLPLLLAASPTTSNSLHGPSLANIDWTRVHQLTLPPLSSDSVYSQLKAAHPYSDPAPLRARASRIAQLSEGWAPYVDALLHAPDLTPRLPADLSTRVRAQYGHLKPGTRRRLSILAQMQDQFTPTLVHALLGEDGMDTVDAGLAVGILAHAGPHDDVLFPSLNHTQDDADAQLVFRSEVVRVALAGALTPAERQAARQRLGRLLLDTRPSMALYYAERVQDSTLIDQAHASLGSTRTVTWQRAQIRPILPVAAVVREVRHEACTPNGYRLHSTSAGLEVLRRGPTAPPPRLSVLLGHVEPGSWSLTLRLDVFRSSPRLQLCTPSYAVGVQVADGPLMAYAPEATASTTQLTAPPAHHLEGLPLGQDVQLSGRWDGPAGLLTLSFQAVDLACTIHALRWNGVDLLCSDRADSRSSDADSASR